MTKTDAPADTRMMGIVHDALQRDLRRARKCSRRAPAPRGRQRAALGRHVIWMMEFLHAHHSGEDAGLWPLVRRRNPGAAPAGLDGGRPRAHRPGGGRVTAAARDVRDRDRRRTGRVALVEALDRLVEVLFPHLDREVAEAMPVVAASITDREWDAVEQQYYIKGKSTRELATEGHWLLDGHRPGGVPGRRPHRCPRSAVHPAPRLRLAPTGGRPPRAGDPSLPTQRLRLR